MSCTKLTCDRLHIAPDLTANGKQLRRANTRTGRAWDRGCRAPERWDRGPTGMFSTGWPPRKRLPQPRRVTGGWPSCCGAHLTDLRQPQAEHRHQDEQNAATRGLAGQTRRRPGRPHCRGSRRPSGTRTGATEEGATSTALRGREVGWQPRGEARGCKGQADVICISRHIRPSTPSIDGGDQPRAGLGGRQVLCVVGG